MSARRVGPVPLAAVVAIVLLAGLGVAGAATGLFGLLGEPPANDDLVGAAPVTDVQLVGSLVDATGSPDEAAAGVVAPGEAAVWFTWTPATHGWAYVSPTLADDAGPHPVVRAYTGASFADLTRVDEPGPDASATAVPVVAGTTYSFAVVGGAGVGDFDLTIFQPDAGVRPNDDPETATAVGAAVFDSVEAGDAAEVAVDTLGGATAAPGEPSAGGPAEHSVWYAWDVPLGGGGAAFAVEPVGGGGPFRVAAWTGTGSADLVPVGGGGDTVTVTGAEGDRILVSVDGPEGFYRLTVTESGVAEEDTEPPVVDCDAPPTGWQADAVVVACTAADAGSGLTDPADATFDLGADVDEGVETPVAATPSRTVCDRAGNCRTVGPFEDLRIDRRAPEVTCDDPPTDWLGDDVEVVCASTDGGSGLVDGPTLARRTDVAAGEERAATLPATTVCDTAGNCTPVPELGPVLVDRAAPVATCDPAPAGIQRTEVEIRCTVADAGSGLADPSLSAGVVLRTDVGSGTADLDASTDAREVCDIAGNCAEVGPVTGIRIDRAAPSVDCAPPSGWSRAEVTIACEVDDDGVGLADGTPRSVELSATLPAGEESDRVVSTSTEVCDAAGNCAAAGPFTVQIDRRAPAVTCGAPPDTWSRAAEVLVDCAAVDGGSGLDDPTAATVRLRATVADGVEGAVATSSAEVCDVAGNCATAGPVAGVRVDRKAPRVTCDEPPAGVSRTEIQVRCEAVDEGAGLVESADASFVLSTSVGAGNAEAAATTGEREVCDLAGNCDTAGPFTGAVDRTGVSGTLDVAVPGRVTVLAAVSPAGPVPVPYEPPAAPGVDVACAPEPGTVLREGWAVVSCDAVADDGATATLAFPIVVKPLPSLAPSGPATRGGAWRSVGVGFAPSSSVDLEIDGTRVAGASAGVDGRVVVTFTLPDTLGPGEHLLVLRGVDAAGDPVLVVSRVSVTPPGRAETPPTEPPATAPALPSTGPAVPVDPGPPPALPTSTRGEPPAPTTTSTTPANPTTTTRPGSTSTTSTGTTGDTGGTGDPTDESASGTPSAASGDGAAGSGDGALGAATLPATGAAVGALVVAGVLLVLGGGSLRAGARRALRRDPA